MSGLASGARRFLPGFAPTLCLLALLGACATTPAAPADAIADLAPGGKLRAAINYGNPVLALKDATTGEPRGVSVDLARELGRRLNVPVVLGTYDAAGKVTDASQSGAWDLAFLAIDPVRAGGLTFTPPYVIIEGAYLVRDSSPLRDNAQVDQPGVRVAVSTGSAYDLFLSRELKQATLVRTPVSANVTSFFIEHKFEARAGVKQQLEADANRIPGLRILPDRFMVINQAMALPKGRDAGAAYISAFIEEMKASGFVAQSLARNRIEGASVAPAGAAPP